MARDDSDEAEDDSDADKDVDHREYFPERRMGCEISKSDGSQGRYGKIQRIEDTPPLDAVIKKRSRYQKHDYEEEERLELGILESDPDRADEPPESEEEGEHERFYFSEPDHHSCNVRRCVRLATVSVTLFFSLITDMFFLVFISICSRSSIALLIFQYHVTSSRIIKKKRAKTKIYIKISDGLFM